MSELLEELPNMGRIYCRPLDYAHKDLAIPKEFIIDYEGHRAYITDEAGQIFDITASASDVMELVIEEFKTNPETLKQLQIEIDGENVSLVATVQDNVQKIKELTASPILTVAITTGSWSVMADNKSYSKEINVEGLKETDYPIVDLKLPAENYSLCTKDINEYRKIYKILTYDGKIKVFAVEPIRSNINIYLKLR